MARLTIVVTALLLTPAYVGAASFDCAEAMTEVEKIICADSQLSVLDEELSTLHKDTLRSARSDEERDRMQGDQRGWLKERNDCKVTSCLRAMYEERIRFLKSQSMTRVKALIPKRYPPYPDVWELVLPPRGAGPGGHAAGIQAIKRAPDGDIVVWYRTGDQAAPDNRLVTFFGQQQLPTTVLDTADGWTCGGLWDDGVMSYKATTGETVWIAPGPTVMNCYNRLDRTVNLSKNGMKTAVEEKVFLYVRPEPRIHRSPDHCNETRSFKVWAEAGGSRLVPLEDGTALLVDTTSGIVLRIGQNLESRSRLVNDKVFEVDKREFNDWQAAGNYGDRADKGIDFARMHRDLIGWLKKKRKEAGK